MEWKELQIRVADTCLIFVLLCALCCAPFYAEDASQQEKLYIVKQSELVELTRLYTSSQDSRAKALEQARRLKKTASEWKESCQNWRRSCEEERTKTDALEKSFEQYKSEVVQNQNRAAAEIQRLGEENKKLGGRLHKASCAVISLSAIIMFILLLIGMCIFLKIKGIIRI